MQILCHIFSCLVILGGSFLTALRLVILQYEFYVYYVFCHGLDKFLAVISLSFMHLDINGVIFGAVGCRAFIISDLKVLAPILLFL